MENDTFFKLNQKEEIYGKSAVKICVLV